jgi:hypothetical protein
MISWSTFCADEHPMRLGLTYRRNASRWGQFAPSGFFVASNLPAMMMTVDEYQAAALCSTRASWRELIG